MKPWVSPSTILLYWLEFIDSFLSFSILCLGLLQALINNTIKFFSITIIGITEMYGSNNSLLHRYNFRVGRQKKWPPGSEKFDYEFWETYYIFWKKIWMLFCWCKYIVQHNTGGFDDSVEEPKHKRNLVCCLPSQLIELKIIQLLRNHIINYHLCTWTLNRACYYWNYLLMNWKSPIMLI